MMTTAPGWPTPRCSSDLTAACATHALAPQLRGRTSDPRRRNRGRARNRSRPDREGTELTETAYQAIPEVASRRARAARGHGRHEVRRHVGLRPRAAEGRRPAARRRARGGQPRRRRPLGDGRHDRRAARPRTRGLGAPGSARARHAHLRRRAHLVRARGDGDRRPRPAGDLAHRARRPESSPTPSTARRRSSRCARSASTRRSTRDGSCSSPASRASRASRSTSRRSAAAAPT